MTADVTILQIVLDDHLIFTKVDWIPSAGDWLF